MSALQIKGISTIFVYVLPIIFFLCEAADNGEDRESLPKLEAAKVNIVFQGSRVEDVLDAVSRQANVKIYLSTEFSVFMRFNRITISTIEKAMNGKQAIENIRSACEAMIIKDIRTNDGDDFVKNNNPRVIVQETKQGVHFDILMNPSAAK